MECNRIAKCRSTVVVAALLIGGLVLTLTGCYLPLRFDADIRITRTGLYDASYRGDLVWIPLYRELREGTLDEADRTARIDLIKRDLARDPATTDIRHRRDGVFELTWHRQGDLLHQRMVSFVRRNERILTLAYRKDKGEIVFAGRSIPPDRVRDLNRAGLHTYGSIAVRTDAQVIEHNATDVRPLTRGVMLYHWRVQSAGPPAPRLVIALQ